MSDFTKSLTQRELYTWGAIMGLGHVVYELQTSDAAVWTTIERGVPYTLGVWMVIVLFGNRGVLRQRRNRHRLRPNRGRESSDV